MNRDGKAISESDPHPFPLRSVAIAYLHPCTSGIAGRMAFGVCWALGCGCRSIVSAIQHHQENDAAERVVGARVSPWRRGRGVEMGVSRFIWPRPDDRYRQHRLVGWLARCAAHRTDDTGGCGSFRGHVVPVVVDRYGGGFASDAARRTIACRAAT